MIGGDGIGPEVTAEGLKALRAVMKDGGFDYNFIEYPYSGAYYLKTRELVPDRVIDEWRALDAVFLGASPERLVRVQGEVVYYFDFADRCREIGIDVPLLPGVMPVYSVKMMHSLARLCGATITREIQDGLAQLPPDDTEALEQYGIELATRQCCELLRHGVPGIHIYTMDRRRAALEIVGRLRNEGLL